MAAVWLSIPAVDKGLVKVHESRDAARTHLGRWWGRRIELGIARWEWNGTAWVLYDDDLGIAGWVRRERVRVA